MKIKEGFKLRQVGGEYMVVAQGVENIDFSNIISLNSTAAYLWLQLENMEFQVPEMAALLIEEFDVSDAMALVDATELADAWINAGIAER